MPSSAQESVCQIIKEFRQRLEKLKRGWAVQTAAERAKWRRFCDEWQQGWPQIAGRLREIDEMLNRRAGKCQGQHPAILQFPPKDGQIIAMGPF